MTLSPSPMTLPHSPRTGGQAHADAIRRLDAARNDQDRRRQIEEDARGSAQKLCATVELSAADEQVAASEAWLSYIERGY
ncbi:MAG: hypothetical protein ACJ76S_07260 [Solirubrobacteraceae bacterium]|jgi:hypothetical protein